MTLENEFRIFLDKVKFWLKEFGEAENLFSTEIGRKFSNLDENMKKTKTLNSYFEGKKSSNIGKNRYIDILPYDRHRVVLSKSTENSDYINASFVNDLNGNRRYIAAQGPLKSTIVDFFRMIHQYEVETIVCLANEIENDRLKFDRYWPEDEKQLEFGPFIVEKNLSDEKQIFEKDFRIFPLTIKRGVHKQKVLFFHFTNWPDDQIPDDEESLLKFYNLFQLHRRSSTLNGPILVHCSAGCGRTGTLITIDLCRFYVDNLPFSPHQDPVVRITSHIRAYRIALIRTLEQYALVYKILLVLAKIYDDEVRLNP